MRYQQIYCTEMGEEGAQILVWVDAHRDIQFGQIVTFKETGTKRWKVTAIYGTEIEGVNRGWGLDLPKSQRTER